jgi:hypothetical protein
LARLFEYPTLAALLRNSDMTAFRALTGALVDCKALAEQQPAVVGCRLPLETDYREFWEFPYPDELKLGMMTALLQARAVLSWMRKLTSGGVQLTDVSIVPRHDARAAIEAIGGIHAPGLVERAAVVEKALYSVVGALVPPGVAELGSDTTSVYRPFDVIDRIRVELPPGEGQEALDLLPLVILDDAHTLHPAQFQALQHWLTRRELLVARWMLTRLDVMHPREALASLTEDHGDRVQLPGITATRDVTEITLQSGGRDRRENRTMFRKMAKDMANRYLRQMPMFQSRGLTNLADLLSTDVRPLVPSRRKHLEAAIDAAQARLFVPDSRRTALLDEVRQYEKRGKKLKEEERLAMLSILMHRYAKRTPQRSLFDFDDDPTPAKPLHADASIFDAARIFLLHKYEIPYYFGIDDVCDASSENAEQFLRLSGVLVEVVTTRLIQSKSPSLDSDAQHQLLRQTAEGIVRDWNFPYHRTVRRLASTIGQRCLDVSLEPNAPLGVGANAYGIPQAEFEEIPERNPKLGYLLQFGIAYNAFTLVPHYMCKGREWCLLELGGVVILQHGLTLKRGGFLEGTARELAGVARDIEV